jgi:CHAT domain-containing protein
MPAPTRRKLALMALGLLPSIGTAQEPAETTDLDDAELQRAVAGHIEYGTCLWSKIRTGFCRTDPNSARRFTASSSPNQTSQNVRDRLRLLSGGGVRTAALIYYKNTNTPYARAKIILVDENGIRAQGRMSIAEGQAAHEVRQVLNVVADASQPAASSEDLPSLGGIASGVLPFPIAIALLRGGYQRLLVLPIGAMGVIPFAALPFGSAPLAEQMSVVVLPGIEALLPLPLAQRWREPSEFDYRTAIDREAFVLGNPTLAGRTDLTLDSLPFAEEEARIAAEAFGTQAIVGADATHGATMQGVRRIEQAGGIVYLATHGVADSVNPMDASFLTLADTNLTAAAIRDSFNMRAPTLVVMSACQTALGRIFDGGAFGLARAWYAAGAGHVVASLWNVSDEGTSFLMEAFIDNLREHNLAPEEALRRAMMSTRETFPDPAIWGSFVSFGNPSVTGTAGATGED